MSRRVLDTTKPYYNVQKFLLESNFVEDPEINNDPIYLSIQQYVKKENIHLVNVRSFAHPDFPNMLRIRSDKFLRKAKWDEEENVLLAILILNHKKFYICFSSKWFVHYNRSLNSSNSFFTIESLSVLKKWSLERSQTRVHKANHISKYIFCTMTSNDSLNQRVIELYFDGYKNIELNAFHNTNTHHIRGIPIETKDYLKVLYTDQCSFKRIHKCFSRTNYEIYRKNYLNAYEYHHIVPKEWFRRQFKQIDISIMHDPINLIPLCDLCHKQTRSRDVSIKQQSFSNVLLLYKQMKLINQFYDYLVDQCHITLNILASIYGVKSNNE